MNDGVDACDALFAYTLAHSDPRFIHQHVVDGIAAQNADENIKPIKLTFALAGLYLLIEHQWTGREVQRAHMRLSQQNRNWPTFALPSDRGAITAIDVMQVDEGDERDRALHAWCSSLWAAYSMHREQMVELLKRYKIV